MVYVRDVKNSLNNRFNKGIEIIGLICKREKLFEKLVIYIIKDKMIKEIDG